MKTKKQLTTFSKVCLSLACVTMFALFVTGVATRSFCEGIVWLGEKYNKAKTEQMFDVTALSSWCGEPIGEIRMIGATAKDNLLVDEQGNQWSIEQELNENDFYLLWIDNMGTKEIKDDEIIKIWKEGE